jgi:hypothetical protein
MDGCLALLTLLERFIINGLRAREKTNDAAREIKVHSVGVERRHLVGSSPADSPINHNLPVASSTLAALWASEERPPFWRFGSSLTATKKKRYVALKNEVVCMMHTPDHNFCVWSYEVEKKEKRA